MKKKKWLFLTVLILALLISGCGDTQQEPRREEMEKEGKLQIGLSFDSFVIERWLRDRDMFVSTAQSLGAEVNVQVAGGIVEEQISQIEYFIKKKMDVIVVIPIDGEALYDVLKEAKDKGIYVICYDRVVENIGADLYITIDNEKVGTLMGEALVQACPQGGNIFAINGSPTDGNVSEVVKDLQKQWRAVSWTLYIPAIVTTGLQSWQVPMRQKPWNRQKILLVLCAEMTIWQAR